MAYMFFTFIYRCGNANSHGLPSFNREKRDAKMMVDETLLVQFLVGFSIILSVGFILLVIIIIAESIIGKFLGILLFLGSVWLIGYSYLQVIK